MGTPLSCVAWILRTTLVVCALVSAYRIRLYAVTNYGRVIHEFDPWFNYRATEYLATFGAKKFFQWYDHTVWYPLGRPVGTTIYPGMQFVSVWLWQVLSHTSFNMSLNDVCVFVPAWFGVIATAFLGLLTYQGTSNVDAAVAASLIMSMIPAHMMRSVAGAFDNECVAVSCLCATFYFWCRAVQSPNSWPWGAVAGMAYFAMVATWGGYIFVLNMIGAHSGVLMILGRYSRSLHHAYSLFFIVGTSLAIQVPVVGLMPLRSLEQMAPLVLFLWFQAVELCSYVETVKKMNRRQALSFRQGVFTGFITLGGLVSAILFEMGYFGPVSARVRGLFLQHTRTGNPLVDSVAEHQATSPRAYWQYLHYTCYLGPIGFCICAAGSTPTDARVFLLLYAATTYYFSAKMNRLVLLLGPVAASLSGITLASAVGWAAGQLVDLFDRGTDLPTSEDKVEKKRNESTKTPVKKLKKDIPVGGMLGELLEPYEDVYEEAYLPRKLAAVAVFMSIAVLGLEFYVYCDSIAEAMSEPTIMFRHVLKNGTKIIVDDYREAYWWLRDNTPEDSRVMAWWDYGYQINGVANRTTIADGNTWNHEHIATLGRCLTSPEKKAHESIRHLADYFLVWAGGGSDDIAKSPHMARIANSVYSDVCPQDPTCRKFAVDSKGEPTPMMGESLLWKLHGHNMKAGVQADPSLFEEAYTSKYGLVRIFKVLNISQQSKAWAINQSNWKCDAPGSWFCPGEYPAALNSLMSKRKAFKQLEDFNAAAGKGS